MSEEIKSEIEEIPPVQVTLKKEEQTPEPSFDYDNYLPSESEITEAEDIIEQEARKREVKN